MKFLCDQMLGTLAKWLRILGFDTFYAHTDMEDKELLQIAKQENRVLITRDKQLIQKARREQLHIVEMQTIDLDNQLSQVLHDVEIDEKIVLTRCSLCNTVLENIQKNDVKDKVPHRIFEQNDQFWFCKTCKKVYWTGSHYRKIIDKINKIKNSQVNAL